MRSRPDVAGEVAALSDLSRDELVKRWRKIYGVSPPKGVRRELMVRAIAWHLQAKRLGGLSAETRGLLRSAVSRVESEMLARDRLPESFIDKQGKEQGSKSKAFDEVNPAALASPTRQRRRLTPGARLMREWNGRTHVVDVIEGA